MIFVNCLKNKKAQIVLPAILLIPTILLVIYLLFETAKLSRFKIRNQFALDSAAFIELTNYSNFLNAVAYTNGAFPFRVFRENMTQEIPPEEGVEDADKKITYYDLFYQAGAFPAMAEVDSNPSDDAGKWELKYKEVEGDEAALGDGVGRPKNWNSDNPKVEENEKYGINSKDLVKKYKYVYKSEEDTTNQTPNNGNSNPEDENDAEKGNGIFDPVTLYLVVYKMFENIYESQKRVYERLTEDGEFFRKSYYLNSSSCEMNKCGKDAVKTFKDYKLGLESVRLDNINWWWRLDGDADPAVLTFKSDEPKYQKFMPLYQFSYLDKNTRSKMKKLYTGVDIREVIEPPDNYFRVNLKRYVQKLHVRAALQCTNESNNCVWPNPTPKYQVRLFP